MRIRRISTWRWLAAAAALTLAACSETEFIAHTAKRVKMIQERQQPEAKATYKVGEPYEIEGVWFYPREDYDYDETGIASWYGGEFHGRPTANGEIYDMNALSAAHRTLPMPSFVRVSNLENGRSITLRVNDRGPFVHGRFLDASRRAAQLLGFERQGTARVRVRILAAESRVIAARLKGETQLAAVASPITVDRLPKARVHAVVLPPPPGAAVAPAPKGEDTAARTRKSAASPQENRDPPNAKLGDLMVEPAKPTTMFIQAGAFAYYHNANRVRATLAALGRVKVSSVLIDGKDLFRVRIGPLDTVDEADEILARIIRTGYSDARIVIDQ